MVSIFFFLPARLKADVEKVDESCVEFEAGVVAQCDALIAAIQRRKTELLREIELQKREKSQVSQGRKAQLLIEIE